MLLLHSFVIIVSSLCHHHNPKKSLLMAFNSFSDLIVLRISLRCKYVIFLQNTRKHLYLLRFLFQLNELRPQWANEENISYALHNDAPITPVDPLHSMWCAVTRRSAKGRVFVIHVCRISMCWACMYLCTCTCEWLK